MNTYQLQCAIDCDPEMKKHISGVYAADEIPHIIHGSKKLFHSKYGLQTKTWPTLDCLLPEW